MMRHIKYHAYAVYLGAVLGYIGLFVTDIDFWIVLIPTILLVTWSKGK